MTVAEFIKELRLLPSSAHIMYMDLHFNMKADPQRPFDWDELQRAHAVLFEEGHQRSNCVRRFDVGHNEYCVPIIDECIVPECFCFWDLGDGEVEAECFETDEKGEVVWPKNCTNIPRIVLRGKGRAIPMERCGNWPDEFQAMPRLTRKQILAHVAP